MLFDRLDDAYAADLGRAERVGCKNDRVIRELDDVNFLSPQLADDGLHSHTLHTNASAYAVHVTITALHCNFGAFAGFPCAPLDDDGGVVDLRHFLFKQPHHQLGRRTGNHHTWTFTGFVHQPDHAPDAVPHR